MTDRHSGYVVILGADLREDDAQAVIQAIAMIKGVLSVEPLVADWATQIATLRVRNELRKKIFDALD